jgi:hypothetical protein
MRPTDDWGPHHRKTPTDPSNLYEINVPVASTTVVLINGAPPSSPLDKSASNHQILDEQNDFQLQTNGNDAEKNGQSAGITIVTGAVVEAVPKSSTTSTVKCPGPSILKPSRNETHNKNVKQQQKPNSQPSKDRSYDLSPSKQPLLRQEDVDDGHKQASGVGKSVRNGGKK